ncbi:MAG: MaoC family dehydratase [Candidatus Dormibacteraeota bacterium]|nr:MaoC family dehydratase [Candidatus Dormibacteraeota bacterium]
MALFAAVAGDFSPLIIDATHGNSRVAPPALLVAMAVGLGSMDMPVPSVAEWEWLNWKFPRAVHAGDTIYARWTLTQKRAPVGGAPTAIVVWRVDVHTAGGALCAEGEIGASVTRSSAPAKARVEGPATAAPAVPTARRRRRRRTPSGDGAKNTPDAKAAQVVEKPAVAAPAALANPERSAGSARRRRRRRSSGPPQARSGDAPTPAAAAEMSVQPAGVPLKAKRDAANPLTRAIRRLRRPEPKSS